MKYKGVVRIEKTTSKEPPLPPGFYNEEEEINRLAKALAKMYFAYLNTDKACRHEFEEKAIEQAKMIIDEYGGLEKLLKES